MLLLRGATGDCVQAGRERGVSIHAPLARSNSTAAQNVALITLFQYMLLLRGATVETDAHRHLLGFQYMLLLRGATSIPRSTALCRGLFQYMLLLRGATQLLARACELNVVSIHAPLARSNYSGAKTAHEWEVSIHAPLARSNRTGPRSRAKTIVSIHAPLARSNDMRLRIF